MTVIYVFARQENREGEEKKSGRMQWYVNAVNEMP